jgi:hypothetical protein
MTDPALSKRLAEEITTELMQNAWNQQAKRLQLRGPNEEDLGGLCRNSVRETIERILAADTWLRQGGGG